MRLIRCPYCGVEFDKRRIEYVGTDPQMQVVVGLLFLFFAVNTWLVQRFFDDSKVLLMLGLEFLLGAALVLRGAYKYYRGRSDFMADLRRHLGNHHLHQGHVQKPSAAAAARSVGGPAGEGRTAPPSAS